LNLSIKSQLFFRAMYQLKRLLRVISQLMLSYEQKS